MPARIYHDEDVQPRALSGKRIGVIGYGNQGRSPALNLRDSGLDVRVRGQRDTTLARAAAEGFATGDVAAIVADSDVVLMLIPDEVMPEVFEREVRPRLRGGACLDFASAYNVAFGLLEPPDHADVVMVAPRMIGPGVRDRYLDGRGFPSFVGVHLDAHGEGSGGDPLRRLRARVEHRAGERPAALPGPQGSPREGAVDEVGARGASRLPHERVAGRRTVWLGYDRGRRLRSTRGPGPWTSRPGHPARTLC